MKDLRALTKAAAEAEGEEEGQTEDKAAEGDKIVRLVDIKSALNDLRILPTTLNQFMDTIMGKSRNPDQPVIQKSATEAVDIAKRVDEAIEFRHALRFRRNEGRNDPPAFEPGQSRPDGDAGRPGGN